METGYARSLSNKGYVLIHGKRAPICGRVCMDQFMVDITEIEDVKIGDLVTLIGEDGDEASQWKSWENCPAGLIMNLSAIWENGFQEFTNTKEKS